MGIKVKVDTREAVEVLEELDPSELGEALVEGVTDEVFNHTKRAALRLGRSIGPRVMRSLGTKVSGLRGEVWAEGADGYVGLHIHTGGPVKSRNGKVLAIPTRWNDQRDKFASDRSDLVMIKSKRKKRLYLFKRVLGPGEVIGRPMFFLTPKTRPQRPRPWWPDNVTVSELADKFLKENF